MDKEQIIEKLWEDSNHGTWREDIEAAYSAGVTAERERIALAWGGCIHEGTPCDMDIGASIRAGELVPWVGGA